MMNTVNIAMKKRDGFTLIELALVLVIGGVLMTALSSSLLIYIKKNQIKVTQQRLEAIDGALQEYLGLNGELPCAADSAAAMDTATFGVSSGDCDAAADTDVVDGSVPVRTINLPDDYSVDAWGNRFTYAVTALLAKDEQYDRTKGVIRVIDSAANIVTDTGHYVLVGHGPDGAGATTLNGIASGTCNAASLDGENCDGDDTFRRTLISGRGTVAAHFDDFIKIRAMSSFGETMPPGAVVAFNLPVCPQGWIPLNSAKGRVVIGTNDLGGETYALGDTGGFAKWQPTLAELGAATNVATASPPAGGAMPFIYSTGAAPTMQDNRPPYIALLYCEKTN